MQTDIILEDISSYTIVDAKYYAAKSAESAPGWPDIAKQMFYEKALREVVDTGGAPASVIHNVFAFPGNSNEGPLTSAEIRRADGASANTAFSPITCLYVSVREVLAFYVGGSQGVELEMKANSPHSVAGLTPPAFVDDSA